MARGGYRGEAFPWGAVKPERRAEKVRAMLEAGDRAGLWALVKHHLMTWGRAGAATSPHTLRTYRTGLNSFLDYLAELGLEGELLAEAVLDPSEDLGAEYLRHLQRHHAPATVNNRRAAARAFYRALQWARATQTNPFDLAPTVRDPTPRHEKRRPYEDDEIKRLTREADPHERVMVLLGAQGGLRISEAARLRWDDVDLGAKRITIRDGKGGKTASVLIPKGLRAALRALRKAEPEGEHVLPWRTPASIRRRLKALCDRAGVRYKGYHALRHYCGTYIYQQTGDLNTAARQLRHSQLQTTAIYAKWAEEMARELLDGWD
ncbi:site-specific integrase [Oceanithermus sp.]|uniref:tyrosine-type recombinase/integrase n=1 Tax=Oceanithermus sp. TaxID=2268145 RepID=UPI00257CC972|nr:site-specific integrase [Oceanithermus sp.]